MPRQGLSWSLLIAALLLTGCTRTWGSAQPWQAPTPRTADAILHETQPTPFAFTTRDPNLPLHTPTPNAPRVLPTLRVDPEEYVVQAGDTLGNIARTKNVPMTLLVDANKLDNPDVLSPGQVLIIPAPTPSAGAPDFKIIPDSELVNSPSNAGFDMAAFAEAAGGALLNYEEELDGATFSGPQIVQRVAGEYSVNPRLLLAILEYQSGFVTAREVDERVEMYPVAELESWRKGLYRQLSWLANNLNRGFYLWEINALSHFTLRDNTIILPAAGVNSGTVGVQYAMSLLYDQAGWQQAVTAGGVFQTYERFFGYPFDFTLDPLVPANLVQPPMHLPFAAGEVWSFTGGPHAGWGDGSAWAAIDFAPPGEGRGCAESNAWVTAVAPGLVTTSANGVVILDLDGDGLAQTGWSVLYLHIEARERVPAGTLVEAGDRIGHPSCEGGVADGAHVHLARRYNGVWISADADLPFNLDGWVSHGDGKEYDGTLERDGEIVTAWNRLTDENQIQR